MAAGILRWQDKQAQSDRNFIEQQLHHLIEGKLERVISTVTAPYIVANFFTSKRYVLSYEFPPGRPYVRVMIEDPYYEKYVMIVNFEEGFKSGFRIFKVQDAVLGI